MNDFIRALPFELWPGSHRVLYDRARAGKTSLFDGSGLASSWSAATHRSVIQRWGLWLEYLLRTRRYDPSKLPSETVTFEALKGYVDELQARVASVTVATYIRDTSEAVRVMQPTADRTLLRQATAELEGEAVPAIDEISALVGASNVYRAGLARMARLERAALDHWRQTLAYGDGLMMAVWISKPVRLETFASTTTSNLVERSSGIDLCYPASASKTRVRVEAALPEALTHCIRYWRQLVATVLTGSHTSALWVTRHGRPISTGWLAARFCRATEEELDVRINPQRVRRIAATSVMLDAPDVARVIQTELDHADPQMARRHYVRTGNLSATLSYRRLLDQRRRRIGR